MQKLLEQFTKERLEVIAKFHSGMALPPSHAEIESLAKIALAAMDANNIGVVYIDPEDGEPTVGWIEEPWDMPPGTKLYTFTE